MKFIIFLLAHVMETSGLEPEAFCLQSKYSTIEICPLNSLKNDKTHKLIFRLKKFINISLIIFLQCLFI